MTICVEVKFYLKFLHYLCNHITRKTSFTCAYNYRCDIINIEYIKINSSSNLMNSMDAFQVLFEKSSHC